MVETSGWRVQWLFQPISPAGIYTGSIYSDGELKRRGFLGESHEDTTVIAIKSHDSGLLINTRFPRAIVIYRRPQESILAEYRRRRAGHTGQVDLKGKRLGGT